MPFDGVVYRALFLAGFPFALFPSLVDGQQAVRGAVRDGVRGAPVEGAMVVLLDEAGNNRASVLTAADGGFTVNVPSAGLYQLRVDRIGYASTPDGPFDVARGSVVQRLIETAVAPVELGRLNVEGARRCEVRPAEGLATASVWEETRKALAAAVWTAERELYRFSWMRYTRDLSANGRRVLDEDRSYRRNFVSQPFSSVDPEVLARDGFLETQGQEVLYSAPDANVILSESFLDSHCFGLESAEDADPPMIGLRFEPIPGRRVPEVEGVLWLESEGAQLRSLEYRYVNLGRRVDGDDASGELTFRGLPNGTWIVNKWRIRMPRLEAENNRYGRPGRYRILGYREGGGVVNRVATATGEVVDQGERGAGVHGLVTDSLGRPLPSMRVWIEGTSFETTTEANGVFAITDVGEGVWAVSTNHPDLEALGFTGQTQVVELEGRESVSVRLELPSAHRVAHERCRSTPPALDEAIVIGRVVDWSGAGVDGARVRIAWSDHRIPRSEDARIGDPVWIFETRDGIESEVESGGTFVFCSVPTEYTVRLTALLGERISSTFEAWIARDMEVMRAKLELPDPQR